jgi:hypothetical protein
MKKTYMVPTITHCDAVQNTKGPFFFSEASGGTGQPSSIGSVGFHL